MNPVPVTARLGYFPAIVCAIFDSPIDALVALCVPRDEAMDLVAAFWGEGDAVCIVATLDGGRPVAVLQTPEGRWAACNAFWESFALRRRKRGGGWTSCSGVGVKAMLPVFGAPPSKSKNEKACIAASLGATGGDGQDRTADLWVMNPPL